MSEILYSVANIHGKEKYISFNGTQNRLVYTKNKVLHQFKYHIQLVMSGGAGRFNLGSDSELIGISMLHLHNSHEVKGQDYLILGDMLQGAAKDLNWHAQLQRCHKFKLCPTLSSVTFHSEAGKRRGAFRRLKMSPELQVMDASSGPASSAKLRKDEAASDIKGAVDQHNYTNAEIVITSLMAGAIAGAAAKTTIAPLDRTKINFQISNSPYSARGALRFLENTYKKEGLLSLWRGNSATMARIVPYAAIQFTAHEQWKRILHVDTDKNKTTPPFLRFLSGAFAGVTSQSLTYPLDLARARIAVTHKEQYSTLAQVFVKMWIEEGPRTFYRGYVPTILGVIPYAGVSFFTYDSLKRFYSEYTGSSTPNPMANLVFGAAAGMLGQSSSYPLDIVRRRMQTSPLTGSQYSTIYGTLVKIYREEGIRRGFFKGLSMNWVKGPVAVGISFATYDYIRHFLRELIALHHK